MDFSPSPCRPRRPTCVVRRSGCLPPLRKPPEIFICSLAMRRTCSARLCGEGARGSAMKSRQASCSAHRARAGLWPRWSPRAGRGRLLYWSRTGARRAGVPGRGRIPGLEPQLLHAGGPALRHLLQLQAGRPRMSRLVPRPVELPPPIRDLLPQHRILGLQGPHPLAQLAHHRRQPGHDRMAGQHGVGGHKGKAVGRGRGGHGGHRPQCGTARSGRANPVRPSDRRKRGHLNSSRCIMELHFCYPVAISMAGRNNDGWICQ